MKTDTKKNDAPVVGETFTAVDVDVVATTG